MGGRFFDSSVSRVRTATLAFGVLTLLTVVPGINFGHQVGYTVLSLLGVLFCLVVIGVTTVLKRPVMTYDGPALGVAVLLIGTGLKQPNLSIAAAFGVVVPLTMYGPARAALARAACLIPALYLATELSPVKEFASEDVAQYISESVAIVLLSGLIWVMRGAMEGQAFSNAREKYLASLSQRLLGATNYDQILKQLKTANMELVELSPGLVVIPANVQMPSKRHPRGSAQMMGVAGAETPASRNLPVELIMPLDQQDLDTFPPIPGATEEFVECGLPKRHWYAYGIDTEPGDPLGVNLMIYGVPMGFGARFFKHMAKPRTEVMDAIRSTTALAMLAKRTTQMYLTMTQQAHHDDLTSMPNRSVLFAELDHAITTSGEDTVIGALVIDLDDFKQINDVGGHHAGDALLIEIGTRISEMASSYGVAARFGGDEFAVLVPHVRDLSELYALGEKILHRIAEPVQLGGGVAQAQASIGLAVTGDGITGNDLLRCADIAMYSAKAAGKGRIDIFSLERHGSVARTRRLEEQIQPQSHTPR